MKHLIMGTAGHVDHGKTSLIKTLTDIDCDTHKEEKLRGITINLGFSNLSLPGGNSIGIIDVPGHKDFINTMVGGACGIDFVLLVIAADSGIMPQTIEHVNIISALGIKKGIVALTKVDLVDEELAEIAKLEIMDFLEKTSLKGAPIISVSSHTGKGKEELIQCIEVISNTVEEKEETDVFRMYIDRIFSVKGAGSVVTGSVLGGSIETGKEVYLLPGNTLKLKVRSIERHGKPVEKVVAGDRAAINLIGLSKDDFKRGMIITNKALKQTAMIDATISLFDSGAQLSNWSSVSFHSGTFECQARMHLLNKDSIDKNEEALVQIHLSKPAILINKDKFILRNTSDDKTLGGGYIIDTSPLHHKKRNEVLLQNLQQLSKNILSDNSRLEMIKMELKKEPRPFLPEEIADKTNLSLDIVIGEIKSNPGNFLVYHSGDLLFLLGHEHTATFKTKIVKALKEHHKDHPIFDDGLETNELLGKLGLSKIKNAKNFLDFFLTDMLKEDGIQKLRNTWIITGHKAIIDEKTKEMINWLEAEILKYEFQKPVLVELEEKCETKKIVKSTLKMYLAYLANAGKIYMFQNDFIHTQWINKFREIVLEQAMNKAVPFTAHELKKKTNATIRFCALMLDIFEQEKIITTQKIDINRHIYITPDGEKLMQKK